MAWMRGVGLGYCTGVLRVLVRWGDAVACNMIVWLVRMCPWAQLCACVHTVCVYAFLCACVCVRRPMSFCH